MGKYVHGLASAAARHGAHLHENSPVTGIRRLNGQAHRLTTPRGSVNARQVLLATGTSAVGPLSWFRRRIVPVGAFLIVTEPLSREQLDALVPGRRNATDTRNFVSYFRVTPDNRLLFGGAPGLPDPTPGRMSKAAPSCGAPWSRSSRTLPIPGSIIAGAGWSI
ncbi:NAD(P)/FAD-dependent oxidoreductase [Sulfitobacter porphyrae]|uniref:NAD(P)/FAD-dependent oxidoreductase n=1 Tax=Sulfitobacter porphyrae TaxID=1246864 RepID=A0ABW2B7P1_9RHOB